MYNTYQFYILNIKSWNGTSLLSISPHFNLSPIIGHCYFSTECSRCLFTAIVPGTLWPKNVVKSGNSHIKAIVSVKRQIHPFAEEFLPTVLTIGLCRLSRILSSFGVIRIFLVVLRVHTGRRRIKYFFYAIFYRPFTNVQVNHGRIMHNVCIILTCKPR